MFKHTLALSAKSLRGMTAKQLLAASEDAAKGRAAEGSPLRLSPRSEVNGDEAAIYIQDAIGGWWGLGAKDFIAELDAIDAKTINLHINSPGGDVFEARDIQAALGRKREAGARIVAHINGLCASAATYIAVNQDEVRMADGALFMVHNAWCFAVGNADELRTSADVMDKIDAGIARDYERKTGASSEQVGEWMKAETWFDAAEALDAGFVDSVFIPGDAADGDDPEDGAQASASPGDNGRARRAMALRLAEVGI